MSSPRRTALFIVTSFWAYGELAIAMEFARRIPEAGYEPLFLVPPTHRETVRAAGLDHQVLIPGAGKINRIQLADIAHVHRPAVVILADFMNYDFCERHYGLTRADLAVFDCPIGTFDDFSWGRPGAWLDTYGFRAKHQGEFTIDGLSFRLRPCPLNSPFGEKSPDVHAYPLLAGPIEHGRAEMGEAVQIRREFGIGTDRPLVLLTGASWQKMHGAYPIAVEFVAIWRSMVEHILTGVLDHADVVTVGPPLAFADAAPPGFHRLGPLDPDRFARLARVIDLHISNNIVSVSLHRLALGGVPSVLLASSLTTQDGPLRSIAPIGPNLDEYATQLLEHADCLYPYRMFPVGWYHFLESLLADNPFTGVVPGLEVFDGKACVASVVALLDRDSTDRIESARHAYLDALSELPTVGTIMESIAEVPAR